MFCLFRSLATAILDYHIFLSLSTTFSSFFKSFLLYFRNFLWFGIFRRFPLFLICLLSRALSYHTILRHELSIVFLFFILFVQFIQFPQLLLTLLRDFPLFSLSSLIIDRYETLSWPHCESRQHSSSIAVAYDKWIYLLSKHFCNCPLPHL